MRNTEPGASRAFHFHLRDLGLELLHVVLHLLGLFQGQPGARAWRRHLSEQAHLPGANATVICDALALVTRTVPAQQAA